MPFYDGLFLGGLAVLTLGGLLMWTQPRSILELALGDDLHETIGLILTRIGGPLLVIGALIHVIVQFT